MHYIFEPLEKHFLGNFINYLFIFISA